MTTPNSLCFCGSEKPYSTCCQPLHAGAEVAQTAEQLMRSRYAAFCVKNIDYLIATHHPSKRTTRDKAELERNFASVQWLGLRILGCQQGQLEDPTGVVEFEARCLQNGVTVNLREVSRFVREEGLWYYLDGELKPTETAQAAQQKLGRNDICFCGSGKKYKKCHGA